MNVLFFVQCLSNGAAHALPFHSSSMYINIAVCNANQVRVKMSRKKLPAKLATLRDTPGTIINKYNQILYRLSFNGRHSKLSLYGLIRNERVKKKLFQNSMGNHHCLSCNGTLVSEHTRTIELKKKMRDHSTDSVPISEQYSSLIKIHKSNLTRDPYE